MNTLRTLRRALLIGFLIEIAAILLSVCLYALRQGREPMEPPFNLIATVLQMPGIIVADWFGPTFHYSAVGRWSVIFLVQSAVWTTVMFAILLFRKHRHSEVDGEDTVV